VWSMIDLKPYGAFIENSIRPLFEETNHLLDRLKLYGIEIDSKLLDKLIRLSIKSKLIESLVSVFSVSIVCLTAYLIAR